MVKVFCEAGFAALEEGGADAILEKLSGKGGVIGSRSESVVY